MKLLNLTKEGIVIGKNALEYLKQVQSHKAMIITGGQSMQRFGVIAGAEAYLTENGTKVKIYGGIGKNPTIHEVLSGLEIMKNFEPDTVLAVGGGSAIDAMKAMVLFYEFPELDFNNVLTSEIPSERRKTRMIVVPSTSGTGSEVTRTSVITDPAEELKVPIITSCLKPDLAILDAKIAMTMPPHIVAETGMDALTHAIECYTNPNLDDFDEVLAKGAIEGLMIWLPISFENKTFESREKVHHYQCMAGIAFTNVGVGMSHGIAHAFGAKYDMGHGLANAVILPFVMEYNSRNPVVEEKLKSLAKACDCDNITKEVAKLKERLQIPHCLKDTGLEEYIYQKDKQILIEHAMLGATRVNPVEMSRQSMEKMLDTVYYGTEIDY